MIIYPLETPTTGAFPRAAYTHKSVGMKAKGKFSYNDQNITLDGGLGCMDWYNIWFILFANSFYD